MAKRKKLEDKMFYTAVTMLACLLLPLYFFTNDKTTETPVENQTTQTEETISTEDFKEKDFVNAYCEGQKEYVLPDRTRVDCLTDEYAIEFDYAKKWAESIGQSLYYAKMTNKKPAVAIIVKSPEEEKYINKIEITDPSIKIFVIHADRPPKQASL